MKTACRERGEERLAECGLMGRFKAAAAPDSTRQQLARIANTIESEIVPRLVLAHRAAPAESVRRGAAGSAERVARFADLVLEREIDAAKAFVEEVRAGGAALEEIYLELLAPAARHLGERWEADLCDFTQVTVALWRLQQIVRDLSPAFEPQADCGDRTRRALLVPVRGEQHTFGVLMVADFMRRSGWDVWAGTPASSGELTAILRGEWFAVVGFSVSCSQHLEGLAADIHAVRRASRNRSVGVMVGGPVFLEHPELAALVGADATAMDARQACEQAESLLAMLSHRG
jgi:methanogenic corrinoid protein MtbC1